MGLGIRIGFGLGLAAWHSGFCIGLNGFSFAVRLRSWPASRCATKSAACRLCPASGVTVRPGTSSTIRATRQISPARNSWCSRATSAIPLTLNSPLGVTWEDWAAFQRLNRRPRIVLALGTSCDGPPRPSLSRTPRPWSRRARAGRSSGRCRQACRRERPGNRPAGASCRWSPAILRRYRRCSVTVPPKSAISSLCTQSDGVRHHA